MEEFCIFAASFALSSHEAHFLWKVGLACEKDGLAHRQSDEGLCVGGKKVGRVGLYTLPEI